MPVERDGHPTDLCYYGVTQTMSYIVGSCLLMKLDGGLSRLHLADGVAVQWLENLGRRIRM